MRRGLSSVARLGTLWATVALTGCSCGNNNSGGNTNNPGGTGNPSPGTVTGTAVDTQGKPIANAKVVLEPSLHKDNVTTTTGADGTYRFEGLPSIPYTAQAWTRVTFNGQQFCLRLGMPEATQYNDFNPSNGAVRNFRWQLTGPIPDYEGKFFGATVHMNYQGDFTGTTMELTFTPTGPQLDGSAASTFKRPVQTNTFDLTDVPVANYTVTGTITKGSEQKPLHIGLNPSDTYDGQSESAALTFQPGDNPCVSLANGVATSYLNVNSPYSF